MDLSKNSLIAAVLLLAVAILTGAVFLRPQTVQVINQLDGAHSIAVAGQGVAEAKPDTATVTLGISVKEGTAKQAQERAAEVANNIVKLLKEKGISEDKIRTQGVNLNTDYVYSPNEPPRLAGYNASSMVSATTGNIAGLGGIIDEAVRAGANQVAGVSFAVKDREKYHREAIEKAVGDARRKAEEAAEKLGVRVAGVKRVQVREAGVPGPVFNAAMDRKMALAEAASQAPPILPGTVNLTVIVDAEFLLN